MRAIIIPNDPLKAYLKKGEMVRRYFNPGDIFDSIDIISPGDSDASEREVCALAGRASMRIYPAGRISALSAVFYRRYIKNIEEIIKPSGADVIIAHNAHVGGFIASRLGRKYGIPVVIHLHTNLDKDVRAHIGWRDLSKKIFWQYSAVVFEREALKYAAKVIAAYRFAAEYATCRGVPADKVEVVYHRIDMGRFERVRRDISGKDGAVVKILCVGRVFDRKNPENIIRALEKIDASLTVIGEGPYLNRVMKVSRDLGLGNKVKFLRSVPNEDIGSYYKDADIFASVNDYGGVSKPVMEAMAASLPIVVKKPFWEKSPELVDGIAVVTDGSAEGFAKAFSRLIGNREEMDALGRMAYDKVSSISGDAMEKKEAEILLSVIKGKAS